MEPVQALEIGNEAIYLLIKVSSPIMLTALGVGLMISLFQALTQIQEMTLSFVPKIMAIFFALIVFMPFIIDSFQVFSEHIWEQIAGLR